MTNRRKLILAVIAITSVLMVGLLFVQLGNIAIRRIRPSETIRLEVSQPIVLGVPIPVHWTAPPGAVNQPVELRLRTVSGEQALASGQLEDKLVTAVFPCSIDAVNGSLSLVEATSGALITWMNIKMLPPGQDCF